MHRNRWILMPVAGLVLAMAASAAEPVRKPEKNGKPLFDGKSLNGWKVVPFGGAGKVEVKDGVLKIGMGDMLTGVTWTNDLVRQNYEISYEARKISGSDFFCALTAPVGDSACTLILGGWGGGVVGISSIDDLDASENETTQYRNFEQNQWYRVRFRYAGDRLSVWLDDKQLIDQNIKDRRISLRLGEIEECAPLGLASWQTVGEIRNIRMRNVPVLDRQEKPKPSP